MAIRQKSLTKVAAVAVNDEEPVAGSRFLFREALKDLFKPGQSYVIVGTSRA